MMWILIVAWLAVATLLVLTAYGPKRWRRQVTSQLRPHREEPTEQGYDMLWLRNLAVSAVALVVLVPITVGWARVSPQELAETARDVVDRVPDDDLDQARFRLEMQDRLHRDVYVTSVDLDDDEEGWLVTLVDPEVEAPPTEDTGSDGGPAVVCFTVSDSDGERFIGAINPGPC